MQSLVPTQINVGDAEVDTKAAAFNLITSQGALASELQGDIEPVVIGPNGQLYQTDGHHTFVALEDSTWGLSNATNPNPTVYVQVIANYSNLTPAQFAQVLAQNTQLYPFNDGMQEPVTQSGSNLLSPIPTSLAGLTQDAYRGLEYSVLKNNGPAGVGHDKTAGYSDFMWANVFRTAPGVDGGSGLPTLTPADANAAAAFAANGSNTGTLPGLGSVKVNQMPGYILPSGGSITVTGVISNANLGTGAIDGSNSGTVTTPSMTGINGYTTNGIVVVPQVSGLLMQLGADDGGTVTLSNTNNTYTGGTTITAGTLITAIGPASDALGAASTGAANVSGCAGSNNYSSCIDNAVRATNGIVFESLTEGNGTLQFGTNASSSGSPMTENRNISIGQEVANINMNGNTVTLTGNLYTPNLNTSGAAPLVVDGKGTLILDPASGSNPLFYGNIEISKGTLQVASDAAMGATTGPLVGEIEMDNGTFQAGRTSRRSAACSCTAASALRYQRLQHFVGRRPDRCAAHADGHQFLRPPCRQRDVQLADYRRHRDRWSRTRERSAGVSVTLTNGITREANATLIPRPGHSGSLGTTEQVFDTGASATVKNGMVAPGSSSITAAALPPIRTTSRPTAAAGLRRRTALGSTTCPYIDGVRIWWSRAASVILTADGRPMRCNCRLRRGHAGQRQTLTFGDGTDPAGLIMDGKAHHQRHRHTGVRQQRGADLRQGQHHHRQPRITGTGGITLSGSGSADT